MRRLLVLLVLGAAAIWTAVALATPSQGQTSSIISVGALQADLAFNTGITAQPNGLTWEGKQYARQPVAGVPGAASRGRRHEPRRVAEPASCGLGEVRDDPGRAPAVAGGRHAAGEVRPRRVSGWHSHPGYLTATVVSGSVVRYATDCSSQTFTAGQSFYETGASTFIVRNESTTDTAVVW